MKRYEYFKLQGFSYNFSYFFISLDFFNEFSYFYDKFPIFKDFLKEFLNLILSCNPLHGYYRTYNHFYVAAFHHFITKIAL